MSKTKKKRYNKKQRKREKVKLGYDTHHLCYQRRRWRNGALYELRCFHYCKILLPMQTLHHMIHEYVPNIPAPKEFNARHALEQLQMLEHYNAIHDTDPIEKRLMLLATLFDCCDQPTADAFRMQLEVVNRFNSHEPL